jgi:hypothetical protein
LSLKTNVDSLSVVWPQNDWDGFLRFGLKTGGDGFSRFGLKTGGGGFPDLGLKIDSYSFLVWASKPSKLRFVDCASKPTGGCDDVGHASRSSSLLHVEASRARVSQSGLKTGGGAAVGGTRGTIVEVTSSSN